MAPSLPSAGFYRSDAFRCVRALEMMDGSAEGKRGPPVPGGAEGSGGCAGCGWPLLGAAAHCSIPASRALPPGGRGEGRAAPCTPKPSLSPDPSAFALYSPRSTRAAGPRSLRRLSLPLCPVPKAGRHPKASASTTASSLR